MTRKSFPGLSTPAFGRPFRAKAGLLVNNATATVVTWKMNEYHVGVTCRRNGIIYRPANNKSVVSARSYNILYHWRASRPASVWRHSTCRLCTAHARAPVPCSSHCSQRGRRWRNDKVRRLRAKGWTTFVPPHCLSLGLVTCVSIKLVCCCYLEWLFANPYAPQASPFPTTGRVQLIWLGFSTTHLFAFFCLSLWSVLYFFHCIVTFSHCGD